jgi:hypothetical protein
MVRKKQSREAYTVNAASLTVGLRLFFKPSFGHFSIAPTLAFLATLRQFSRVSETALFQQKAIEACVALRLSSMLTLDNL